MASFSDLPEDVVVEIMSWLPPESLLRFKCVQKSWYFLINALVRNPIFVNKHLYNSSNKISCLFFKRCKNNITNQQGILTISNDEDNPRRYLNYVAKEFVPSVSLFGSKFYGPRSHCNGIICQFSDRSILLCNPSTMEYKLLPGPCFDGKTLWTIRYVGFGYDAIDDVYKIVRVHRCFGLIRADVFNLGSDCWREIKMKIESEDDELSYYFGEEQLYCKGVYYWMMREVSSLDEKIRSFDMHDEEFHTISLPDHFQKRVFITKLTQWKGSVALFYYRKNLRFGRNPIEVWCYDDKMDESDCWTKHLSINCPVLGGIYCIPIVFWKSDELLIREEPGLISYNIHTKKFKSLRMEDVTCFDAFSFVKSLVPLSLTTRPTYLTTLYCCI